MANHIPGIWHRYEMRRFLFVRILLGWAVFGLGFLGSVPLFSQQPAAWEPSTAVSAAALGEGTVGQTDVQPGGPADVPTESVPDLTFYLSPVKMIRTQMSEVLLNSQEWTDYFSEMVRCWDARHLHREPASRLMMQLDRTFSGNSRSLNDPLNLFFFNLQGMWGSFILTDGMRPEPADPFLTFLSDFEPNEVAGLTAAFFDELGYTEQETAGTGIERFGGEGKSPYYFGLISPLKTDSGKSLFFLTRTPQGLILAEQDFPFSDELKSVLSDTSSVFLIVSLTSGGIGKGASILEQRTDGGLASKFAPQVRRLGENIQSVWLVMQETSGQTQAMLTFECRQQSSSDELRRLFDESREILAEWMKGRELTAKEALLADLAERMELIQEDNRVYVILKVSAPETIEKIKQAIVK